MSIGFLIPSWSVDEISTLSWTTILYCRPRYMSVDRKCHFSTNSCFILMHKVPLDSPWCALFNEYRVPYSISKCWWDINFAVDHNIALRQYPCDLSWKLHGSNRLLAYPAFNWLQCAYMGYWQLLLNCIGLQLEHLLADFGRTTFFPNPYRNALCSVSVEVLHNSHTIHGKRFFHVCRRTVDHTCSTTANELSSGYSSIIFSSSQARACSYLVWHYYK